MTGRGVVDGFPPVVRQGFLKDFPLIIGLRAGTACAFPPLRRGWAFACIPCLGGPHGPHVSFLTPAAATDLISPCI